MLIAYAVEAVLIAWVQCWYGAPVNKPQAANRTLAMELCCVCWEGMKSKNWRVVRDVDVFKILLPILFSRTVLKNKTNKTHQNLAIQQMLLMIEI